MTGAEVFASVPWLVFAAGLAVIGARLAAGRVDRRRWRAPGPGKAQRPSPGACQAGEDSRRLPYGPV